MRSGHDFAIPMKYRQFQYLLVVYIYVFERIFGVPACVYKIMFSRLHVCFFVVHLKEEKVPGHGAVDTCSFAGLFPGVRRSSVSFVFSFKILILAMKPGCVELSSCPSNHMQELKKKENHLMY